MQYATPEDLLMDPQFINWVRRPDESGNAYWQAWVGGSSERKEMLEQARLMLLTLHVQENELTDTDVQLAWQRFRENRTHALPLYTAQPSRSLFGQTWFRAAAVLLLCFSLGLAVWLRGITGLRGEVYQTAYGELRTVTLPDGSIVDLNANSRLRLASEWDAKHRREVWLEGEGFFRITKKPGAGNARFVVHTGDLDVEVLGTSFNVNNRRQQTQVVLNTGMVQLNLHKDQDSPLVMKPGDAVVYVPKEAKLLRKVVNPAWYHTWTDKILTLDHITLGQLGHTIEDTYGKKVRITDSVLTRRILNGTLPTDNQTALLEAIAATLDIQVRLEGDTVVFYP